MRNANLKEETLVGRDDADALGRRIKDPAFPVVRRPYRMAPFKLCSAAAGSSFFISDSPTSRQ